MKQSAFLLLFYGIFLILIGILSVLLIGWTAKTALISGGTMGFIALTIAHFINKENKIAQYLGLLQTITLSFIFGWRASKALFALLELVILNNTVAINGKLYAFFLINLMMIVSVTFSGILFSNIIKDLTKKN